MAEPRYDVEFIEFIVQEVIRRLSSAGLVMATSAGQTNGNASARELVLSERLITLATLQGRLDGVRKLTVPRKALLTPAVRDELRARQVELHRQ